MNNLVALLGDTLLQPGGDGTVSTSEALKSKTVGLYFSAHWCPPCRKFTPQLAKKYKALKEAGKDFEIVFVSSDRDEDAFDKYHGEMPILTLPFQSHNKKRALSTMYNMRSIPTLVVLNSDGDMITEDGRMAVSSGSYIEEFPWISSSSCFFDSCLNGDASEVMAGKGP